MAVTFEPLPRSRAPRVGALPRAETQGVYVAHRSFHPPSEVAAPAAAVPSSPIDQCAKWPEETWSSSPPSSATNRVSKLEKTNARPTTYTNVRKVKLIASAALTKGE